MDFDRNHFLTDTFEAMLGKLKKLSGTRKMFVDLDRLYAEAVQETIDYHVGVLRELAQDQKANVVGMADEWRKTGKPVHTRWSYQR